jgi:hypothetical protein
VSTFSREPEPGPGTVPRLLLGRSHRSDKTAEALHAIAMYLIDRDR